MLRNFEESLIVSATPICPVVDTNRTVIIEKQMSEEMAFISGGICGILMSRGWSVVTARNLDCRRFLRLADGRNLLSPNHKRTENKQLSIAFAKEQTVNFEFCNQRNYDNITCVDHFADTILLFCWVAN